MSSNETVISAQGLTKVFKDFWGRPKARAVDGIDFEVRRGEGFGLLGPNGSGKSTIVKMLLGLLYPTRGRITVFDHSPRHVQTKARIGYLPEESYLYRYLNSDETIDFFGSLFHIDSKERRERAEQLIEMVGLENARRRHVGEFSKGMQRRIGLAQALINDPDLLILDELGYVPFSKAGAELLFEVVSRAYERQSLILTTNLPFEQWTEILVNERLTGALLDRITHRVHIIEANGESYRLKDAKKRTRRKNRKG